MSQNNFNFENLSEGMTLPELKKGPITRQQLVDYASASGDYNKLHYDEAFAKKAGLEGPIAHGMLVMSMAGTFIKNWAKGGILKNFKVRFTGMTKENDILIYKGKIEKKRVENGEKLIEISFISETQDNRITTQGNATIAFK
ncbi:MAG: MaoC/PaaZ C-terminal domain-containing protein [Promethearchaeota archaeon]